MPKLGIHSTRLRFILIHLKKRIKELHSSRVAKFSFPEMHVDLDKILFPWFGNKYKSKWSLDMSVFIPWGKKRKGKIIFCVCFLCDRPCSIVHKY